MLQNFSYNGQLIQRREDGLINLTQMCNANGKRIDHWKELKSTKTYIKTLQANYPGLRVVETVEGVNGGTWGHPSLAINLARWISNDFAIWCDHHILRLMETGQTAIVEFAPTQPTSTESALVVIDLIFNNVPIKPELVAGVKINVAKRLMPDIAMEIEGSRQLLIVNTAQSERLVTPTEIGKALGISGQAVNKLLIERGLQVPNEDRKSRKEPAYLPTEKGKEYSDLTLATGSNSSSTYQQLRWYESVIDLLK